MEYMKIETSKKAAILVEGYVFHLERQTVIKKLYKCGMYYKTGCKARAHICDSRLIVVGDPHNHCADAAKVAAMKHIENMKKKARD